MKRLRRSHERGHADHGWLDTYHTFSFSSYYDPSQMRFRTLRVINEDRVAPGQGFGTHPHENMEIVTYVLEGALEHRDSMGNGEILHAGEMQRMSAGTGITHSEFNPSHSDSVHLYQIWLFPKEKGILPSYEQKRFLANDRANRWQLVVSPNGDSGSMKIHQDCSIYLANLQLGHPLDFVIADQRHLWLQVLRGTIEESGQHLEAGDGLAISGESRLEIRSQTDAELMLFDLN